MSQISKTIDHTPAPLQSEPAIKFKKRAIAHFRFKTLIVCIEYVYFGIVSS